MTTVNYEQLILHWQNGWQWHLCNTTFSGKGMVTGLLSQFIMRNYGNCQLLNNTEDVITSIAVIISMSNHHPYLDVPTKLFSFFFSLQNHFTIESQHKFFMLWQEFITVAFEAFPQRYNINVEHYGNYLQVFPIKQRPNLVLSQRWSLFKCLTVSYF